MINSQLNAIDSTAPPFDSPTQMGYYYQNDTTSWNISNNNGSTGNQTLPLMQNYSSGQGDPLIYIIGVLSFYIVSITVLLLKYIRTQRQEEMDQYNYNAFMKRRDVVESVPQKDRRIDLAGKQTLDLSKQENEHSRKMISWKDIPSTSAEDTCVMTFTNTS